MSDFVYQMAGGRVQSLSVGQKNRFSPHKVISLSQMDFICILSSSILAAKPTLTCSKPQPITFGSYTVRETDVANFVEYKCHAGFSLQGNSYAVCVFPGFWNGSAPVCMPNSTGVTKSASVTHFTGNFSPVPTAKIVDNRTSPWANIWSPKLLPTGKPTRFDEELGLPTTPFDLSLEPNTILPAAAKPIRCEYPPQVVNGAYLYDSDENAIGTFLIYTCQPGFTLVGDRVLQCLHSGNWSQTPPTCQSDFDQN